MERLTYDFFINGIHYIQVEGADNLECKEVCEKREGEGCKGCPIAKAFDRLAEIEDILGDDYDLDWIKRLVTASKEHRAIVLDEGYKIVSNEHKNWMDNAGSYICPVCGFETNNPNKLQNKTCPECGFVADKDLKK